jgi:hypothetical protein
MMVAMGKSGGNSGYWAAEGLRNRDANSDGNRQ